MDIHCNKASCDIRIAKDGTWYYLGSEMFRKDIVNYFYKNLKRDQSGRYLIELEDDLCYLDVEDTAFVVKAASRCAATDDNSKEFIEILLSDDTVEKLDCTTLRIGTNNIPYCTVKNLQFDARFSQASYYQLAQSIDYDPEMDVYYIVLNGHTSHIRYLAQEER